MGTCLLCLTLRRYTSSVRSSYTDATSIHTCTCDTSTTTSGENSAGSEDGSEYTILNLIGELKELDAASGLLPSQERIPYEKILSNESYGRYNGRSPRREQATQLLHDGSVHQAFHGSAFNGITSSEDTFIDSVEITERDSVTFLGRVQLFLQDPNAPWVLLPDLSNGIWVYHHMAGVATPAHDRCGSDALALDNSLKSETTFYTTVSQTGSAVVRTTKQRLQKDSEYAQILARKRLWPVDTSIEQDWSGRGQHVEFQKGEREIVNEILRFQGVLGRASSAIVESVKCRRILLARKTIVCSRRLTKEEAVDEFAHLTRLDHSHIVRVIGTYTFGRELSILMYPVAEYNLEDVLHKFTFDVKEKEINTMVENMANSALGYFACLSNALEHIHHKLVKHMDIKPRNILVRAIIAPSRGLRTHGYKVYLTDFGSSRSYQTPEDVETDGLTSFTRKYAAPEVVRRELHGFPADIFSLGCVFLEILAYLYDHFGRDTILPSARSDIKEILATNANGSSTYYANTARLEQYVVSNGWTIFFRQHPSLLRRLPPDTVLLVQQMLSLDPKLRPTAKKLVAQFGLPLCCVSGREALEAMSNEQQDTTPEITVVANSMDVAEVGAWSQPYYGSVYSVWDTLSEAWKVYLQKAM